MTASLRTLIPCIDASISGSVTQSIDFLRLSSISKDFDAGFFCNVANTASLPAAANNTGRLVYIDSTCGYRISDGTQWTNDFTSVIVAPAFSWGCGGSGQLGNNCTTDRSSPVSAVGGFTDWCQVSTGTSSSPHSLAVRINGTLWGWGNGGQGKLGNNSVSDFSSPVIVAGGFTNWCQVSAGHYHSLGVRTNGTAWAWGSNYNGQLGDNTMVCTSSPVSVVGGFTDWCQVSAGFAHSLAVRQNGTAWAWGAGLFGRLGNDCASEFSSPVSVAGGFTDWRQVSAGRYHSLGVRANGTAWGWGRNLYGSLGIGTGGYTSSPVIVAGGFTDWCQVSAGDQHSLGVRTNGTAWAWGRGISGRLGNENTVNQSSPVSVVGGFTDWCQVSAGVIHSVGIRTNGTAWAWGCGGSGRLGTNSTTDRSSPVSVVGGFTDWCTSDAGQITIALRKTRGF